MSDTFWAGYPRHLGPERLIDPAVSLLNDAYHHAPTGAVLTSTIFRGQWTHAAIEQLRRCLAATLPERHVRRILNLGLVRVLVFLGTTPSSHHAVPRLLATRLPVVEDLTGADAAMRCSVWAFDQAVAVLTGSSTSCEAPLAASRPDAALDAAFREAAAAFGDDICPPSAHWAHRTEEGDWTELRESSPYDIREHLYQWSSYSDD